MSRDIDYYPGKFVILSLDLTSVGWQVCAITIMISWAEMSAAIIVILNQICLCA